MPTGQPDKTKPTNAGTSTPPEGTAGTVGFPTVKKVSETSQKADYYTSLAPENPAFETYQGHPWTKMYDDIVPEYNLKQPALRDLDYYAENFGLDTSVSNLQKKFDALTQQEYAQKRAAYRTSEDQYYKDMSQQGAQYQSAIQNAASQALASGASRGMQFANQFAAQNELAEQNSTGALDLATQRNNLSAQEAEAYTQNAINADDTMRNLKTNILGQAVVDRANSVQRYAADAQLAATDATLRVNNYQFNMSKEYERMYKNNEISAEMYINLLDNLSQMYGSDMNYLEGIYGSDMNYLATKYNADANASRYGTGGYSGGTGGYNNTGNYRHTGNVTPQTQELTFDQRVEYMKTNRYNVTGQELLAWKAQDPLAYETAFGTDSYEMTASPKTLYESRNSTGMRGGDPTWVYDSTVKGWRNTETGDISHTTTRPYGNRTSQP